MNRYTKIWILGAVCAALLACPSGTWARSRHESRHPRPSRRPESTRQYDGRTHGPSHHPPVRRYHSNRSYGYGYPVRPPPCVMVAPPVHYYYGPAWYPQPPPRPVYYYPVVYPGVSINLRF